MPHQNMKALSFPTAVLLILAALLLAIDPGQAESSVKSPVFHQAELTVRPLRQEAPALAHFPPLPTGAKPAFSPATYEKPKLLHGFTHCYEILRCVNPPASPLFALSIAYHAWYNMGVVEIPDRPEIIRGKYADKAA